MKRKLLTAGIVAIGWAIGVVLCIVLGILYDTAFLGIAAGSIITAVVARYVLLAVTKIALQRMGTRVSDIDDELTAMREEIDDD